jgi:chromate reductase
MLRDVAVFVGSLRKESFNRKIASALPELSPPELSLEMVEIAGVSFYNQDLESNPPADWTALRDRVRRADALLFVTPEYNRSVPGVLKNAVDVASRPLGKAAWAGKPGGVISVTPGALGGMSANHDLRKSLMSVNVAVMPHPEVYLHGIADSFDAEGRLVKEATRTVLTKFMQAFAVWVARIKGETV